MISSKSTAFHCVFTPSFPATALNRSTSNPATVLSGARNSLGSYRGSVATVSAPADRIGPGTCAASAVSTVVDGAGAVGALRSLLVQPAVAAARTTTTSHPSARISPPYGRPAGRERRPSRHSRLRASSAEVGPYDLRVAGQLAGRPFHVEQSGLHDVGPVRDAQRGQCVLLHQQYRGAVVADRPDGLEDQIHQHRRQPHRRLVQQEQLR